MWIKNIQIFTVYFATATVPYTRRLQGQIVSHPARVCLLVFYDHVTIVVVLCQLSGVYEWQYP